VRTPDARGDLPPVEGRRVLLLETLELLGALNPHAYTRGKERKSRPLVHTAFVYRLFWGRARVDAEPVTPPR
jgi:hypothetical protein